MPANIKIMKYHALMKTKLPTIKFNPKTETLVLRCCKADMTSQGEFKWPKKGVVKDTDFSKNPECGQGLHGWAKGEGDFDAWSSSPDDKWLVLAVKTNSLINLGGKVKFPSATVLYCGEKDTAAALIQSIYPEAAVIYGTVTVGDHGTATAGDGGIATAGNYGTAAAGSYGKATAGHCGKATVGDGGTAIAGGHGTAIAGDYGILQIKKWDSKCSRYRIITGYIGENGLKPNTEYKLNEGSQFVEA